MKAPATKQAGAAATAPGLNVVKAAGLTTLHSVTIEGGQLLPALIDLHIGVPFLADREKSTGERRANPSGQLAAVQRLTEKGRAVL